MKKNIVHIITSLKIGGAETLLVDFLENSSSQQAHHSVVFFHDGPNRQRLMQMGIPCYHIKGLFSMYDPLFFLRLYRTIKHLKPDCIHTWLWSANVAGRIINLALRLPLLNSFHLGVDLDGPLRNSIDRSTHHIPDRMIAVSHGVAATLIQKFKLTKPERLKVIKNGIDAHSIEQKCSKMAISRERLNLTQDHYVIGSVGRWIARKNYIFLLEVFAQLYTCNPMMRLVLLGKGEEKNALHNKAIQLGMDDKVIFIEGQPAFGYYPLFDCFIQTSFKEGVSIALLEAMSCSLPCIVTEPLGVHEVIRTGFNGIIVPSYNHTDVCTAIEELAHNKEMANNVGKNAYKTLIHEFGLTPMVDAYHQEYNQIINSRQKCL